MGDVSSGMASTIIQIFLKVFYNIINWSELPVEGSVKGPLRLSWVDLSWVKSSRVEFPDFFLVAEEIPVEGLDFTLVPLKPSEQHWRRYLCVSI